MLAVLLSASLSEKAADAPYEGSVRDAYCRSTYAAMLAARVFNPFRKADLAMTPNRVRRLFLLYMQHFRCCLGTWNRASQLQLLYEPAVDFRNVSPDRMVELGVRDLRFGTFRQLVAEHPGTTAIWITYPSRYLTPRVLRVTDAASARGMFDGSLAEALFDVDDLSANYAAAKTLFSFIKGDGDGKALFSADKNFDPIVRYAVSPAAVSRKDS